MPLDRYYVLRNSFLLEILQVCLTKKLPEVFDVNFLFADTLGIFHILLDKIRRGLLSLYFHAVFARKMRAIC